MKKWISLLLCCLLLVGCFVGSASAKSAKVKVGQSVFLGHYEQDNNLSNGEERIEWIVLDVEDHYALVISKYCLDAAQFNSVQCAVTWETSELREWLNDDFLYDAFTSEERKAIMYIENQTPDSVYGNKTGGNDTMDRVFCLSIDEANQYFENNEARKASLTAYAATRTSFAWWWLRSPGGETDAAKAIVDANGQVGTGGNWVNNNDAVRPCLVVDLDA